MKARAVLLLCLTLPSAFARADEVVITAVPMSRVVSTSSTTERSLMTDAERTKALLVIQKNAEGGYRWTSRENRGLYRHDSGAFVFFIDPRGGGYVKILSDKQAANLLGEECGNGYAYFETLSMGVSTITYWGCAADLAL